MLSISKKTSALIASTALTLGLIPAAAFAAPTNNTDLASAQARMEQMGTELIALNDQLEEASTELERTDNLIDRIDQERIATESELSAAKAVLATHLRSSYKSGGFDYLDFLFSADTLDDLIGRFYYMEKISKNESDAIKAVNELSSELLAQKTELEEQRSAQEERVASIEKQVGAQQSLVAEARDYYNRLDSNVREELERQATAATRVENNVQQVQQAQQEQGSAASSATDTSVTEPTQPDAATATAAVIDAINEPEPTPVATPRQEEQNVATSQPEPEPEPEPEPQPEPEPEVSEDEPVAENSSSGSPYPGGGVASAYSCLGWPYVYGGYLPSMGGFDCSGLVSYCYGDGSWRRGCESLAAAIQDAGLWVSSVDQLNVGDLVFTDSEYNHVQIYIGGGQVIHAPYPGRVVCIQDIYSFYGGGPFVMP